jgi:hypothetical protein
MRNIKFGGIKMAEIIKFDAPAPLFGVPAF